MNKNVLIDDELMDLVDHNDQVIGQERRSIIHQKNLSNFRAVNAFVINSEGKLWIPRRCKHKPLFPLCLDSSMGGCVKAGETYQEAFARELMEELRIDANTVHHECIGILNPLQHKTAAFMQVYLLKSNTAPNFNIQDFVEYYWLTPQEVLERIAAGDTCKDDLPKMIQHLFIK